MNATESVSTTPAVTPRDRDEHDLYGSSWYLRMNYLMPLSVMIILLCTFLLMLFYIKHKIRARRQRLVTIRLQSSLANSRSENIQFVDPKTITLHPPSYDEAVVSPSHNQPPLQADHHANGDRPPPYTTI